MSPNEETPRQETSREKVKRLLKGQVKKEGSTPILVMESDLYDWNPGARMLLLVIALGARTNPDAYFPEDCPYTKEECMGWCDRSQFGLSLRVGKSETQINRDILMFEHDGVIKVRRWKDSNETPHDMYRINRDVLLEHQRPSQKLGVKRPSRYKKKREANKGSFSTKNQPRRVSPDVAEMDEAFA